MNNYNNLQMDSNHASIKLMMCMKQHTHNTLSVRGNEQYSPTLYTLNCYYFYKQFS